MNSNDNSKKLKVFYDIAHRAEENLRDLSGYWNILEKQRYFIRLNHKFYGISGCGRRLCGWRRIASGRNTRHRDSRTRVAGAF